MQPVNLGQCAGSDDLRGIRSFRFFGFLSFPRFPATHPRNAGNETVMWLRHSYRHEKVAAAPIAQDISGEVVTINWAGLWRSDFQGNENATDRRRVTP
jgi:hypothetical protein